MKEDVMQIVANEIYIFALCKGGKIYRRSMHTREELAYPPKDDEWVLFSEAPKMTYKRAKSE